MKSRSLFFVPAHIEKFLEKSIQLEADIIILDLEDSVPNKLKKLARKNIELYATKIKSLKPLFVRINSINSSEAKSDIKLISKIKIDGVIIPKVLNKLCIEKFIETSKLFSPQKPTFIYPLIECAKAIQNLKDISTSSSLIKGLIFGHEDYLNDLGGFDIEGNENLVYPRSKIIVAAKANNLIAIDTPFLNLKDKERTYEYALKGRHMGFDGMLVLHPEQISSVNSGYSPSIEEINRALELISNYESNSSEGRSISYNGGNFIAPPIIKQSRNLLKLAKKLELISEI